ncbi:MAG: DUF2062 domain-containing protein [Casimicrobiaceae bacterium]|nr:DUF2062 domain-containing protein [Casimicrobiaceae bacterium]MCX8098321.1 DUF2062 domain-containing protein [Casimicrobiaceae bacterium]MDW8311743.1 DUF2062 domain-containing protein [Burkholderiales bacterium]
MRLRRWLVSLEPKILEHFDRPWLAWLKPALDRSDMLAFRRRPLAVGAAIGVALGVIPTQAEVILVAILCALFRGNLVMATLAGWYNNAFTFVGVYWLGYLIGEAIFPGTSAFPNLSGIEFGSSLWFSTVARGLAQLGWPTVVGTLVLGLGLAALAYFAVQALWLWPVWKRLRRMRARREGAAR